MNENITTVVDWNASLVFVPNVSVFAEAALDTLPGTERISVVTSWLTSCSTRFEHFIWIVATCCKLMQNLR